MKKYIFILMGVVTILGIIAFVAFKSLDSNIETAQKDPKFETLPPIISQIKTLEVVNARIVNPGSPNATIFIDIKNHSPKPIIAITVESGDNKDSSGDMISGFVTDSPQIIGKPFEVFTISTSPSNIVRDLPLRISGVFYADNSEDGDVKTLNRMRGQKEAQKAATKKRLTGGTE